MAVLRGILLTLLMLLTITVVLLLVNCNKRLILIWDISAVEQSCTASKST